jgi:hypothetical protein
VSVPRRPGKHNEWYAPKKVKIIYPGTTFITGTIRKRDSGFAKVVIPVLPHVMRMDRLRFFFEFE